MNSVEHELHQLAKEHGGQLYLVRWLAKEDSSTYGECMGADFDRLFMSELVTQPIPPTGRPIEYAQVSLTEKGYALNRYLREQDALLATPRSAADYSREFAGYMADAAEAYINAVISHRVDQGDEKSEDVSERYRGLRDAIYEWRKRESIAQGDGTKQARPGDAK